MVGTGNTINVGDGLGISVTGGSGVEVGGTGKGVSSGGTTEGGISEAVMPGEEGLVKVRQLKITISRASKKNNE